MNKEEGIKLLASIDLCLSEGAMDDAHAVIEDYVQQAIAEHEQGKWNDFTPQTLPIEGDLIIIKFPPESKQDPIITRYSQITDNFSYGDLWKPYQEGGEDKDPQLDRDAPQSFGGTSANGGNFLDT